MIESVERQEFEQQMGKLHVSFLSNGLGLKPDELIGDSGDFDTVGISLDLHGEERVINHPLTITIRSRERVDDGTLIDLVRTSSSFSRFRSGPIGRLNSPFGVLA